MCSTTGIEYDVTTPGKAKSIPLNFKVGDVQTIATILLPRFPTMSMGQLLLIVHLEYFHDISKLSFVDQSFYQPAGLMV